MKEIITDKIVWIDVVMPSEEELQALKQELNLPESLINELRAPSLRDKVNIYDKFIYTVLYFPIWNETKKISEPEELDIILDKRYIVTIRYNHRLEPLNDSMKKCESLTKSGCNMLLGDTTYKGLYFLMEELLEFSNRQLKHIEDKLTKMEEGVFCHKPNENLIFDILGAKRDLIDFRKIYLSLHSCLDILEFRGEYFWDTKAKMYLLDLRHDGDKVWNNLEHHLDLLNSLETTLYTMIDHRTNTLTRIYTILSFITWPTLIVISWYQTNARHLPLIGMPFDAYIILLLAFLPSLLIYLYLKKKQLL